MTSNFYIHIPFCRKRCTYCTFALVPLRSDVKKRLYLEHLTHEIDEYFTKETWGGQQNRIPARTIYFWWGTPSMLTGDEIAEILAHIYHDKHTEITLECNPEDITREYALEIKKLGITRISLWVQSLDEKCLETIHRSSPSTIYHALDSLEHARMRNINIDFILWLPFSPPGETLSSIKKLHTTYPHITHTSVYLLEPGLYPRDWENASLNDTQQYDAYYEITQYFESIWWHHYEISNWARPWYECRHNQNYWNHTPMHGFWLSAASYEHGERYENAHSFNAYYRGERVNREIISEKEQYTESIIFWLRTFSLSAHALSPSLQKRLIQEGKIEICDEKIRLTPLWIFEENRILSEILFS